MGSSRKHKKHKTDKSESRECRESGEQKPLRLVLKVPQTMFAANGAQAATTHVMSASMASTSTAVDPNRGQTPPKLLAFNSCSQQMPVSSGSVKKMKKKKSKKRHKKHSHHHSRHRHHSHHHRHRVCSHHSRPSQDSSAVLQSTSTAVVVNKSPQKSGGSSKSSTKSQFQQFVWHLLKQLQRKDIQQFFAWPVSDMIAPGYSSIISQPMDLSSMKQKIDQNQYENLLEFKADIKLMCDNAMKYNRPETVYYKAANKLWHYARNKLLNKDSLLEVARTYPGLSSYELGFYFDEPLVMSVEPEVPISGPEVQTAPIVVGETLPLVEDMQQLHEADMFDEDGMTPEQILEEAKKAAQAAADRLTLQRPQGAHFSFLRQRADGSTTLSIVGNHSAESVINLEALAGKLTEGTASLNPFKESEINRVKPIETVNDSPFASYLPALDSSRATLNEEDSALLLSTYGDDEFGLKYAQSITHFAHDADYVLNLVDSLLDILTHGQHTKNTVRLRDQQRYAEVEPLSQNISATNSEPVDSYTSIDNIQSQLNETGSLIGQLESLQYQRLSSSAQVVKPSLEEEKLANQLSSKLTNIIGNCATPGQVSDVNAIRKSMGIKIKTEK